MYKYDSGFNAVRDLQNTGCNKEIISSFLNYQNNGEINECLKLLQTYRKSVLGDLCNNQKQIDCLDYFIYQIRKQIKK